MGSVSVAVPIVPVIVLLIVMILIAEKDVLVIFAVPHVAPIVIYLVVGSVKMVVHGVIVKELVLEDVEDVMGVPVDVNMTALAVVVIIVVTIALTVVLVPPTQE